MRARDPNPDCCGHARTLLAKLYGEEPIVALLEASTFGSPGGGKESVYRLYLVTTILYFARI